MNQLRIRSKGDKILFELEEYIITEVHYHGGSVLYYDLEAVEETFGVKRIQWSVHHSDITDIVQTK